MFAGRKTASEPMAVFQMLLAENGCFSRSRHAPPGSAAAGRRPTSDAARSSETPRFPRRMTWEPPLAAGNKKRCGQCASWSQECAGQLHVHAISTTVVRVL